MDLQLLTVITEEELRAWPREKWLQYQWERKEDGARMIYMNGEFYARSGKQTFSNIDHIKRELDSIPGVERYVLDGELHGESWNNTMSIARAGEGERNGESLRFTVFDCIPLDGFDGGSCALTLEQRQGALRRLIPVGSLKAVLTVNSLRLNSYDEFVDFHKANLASGCDGTVGKLRGSLYEFTRTKTWLKVKPVLTCEAQIVGTWEGNGKYSGMLGAYEILPEGQTATTRMSGMTDTERDWGHAVKQIGRICEVKYRGIHKSGRLIEPRFLRWRPDKEG